MRQPVSISFSVTYIAVNLLEQPQVLWDSDISNKIYALML